MTEMADTPTLEHKRHCSHKLLLHRAQNRVKRHKAHSGKQCEICCVTFSKTKRLVMPKCKHTVCLTCGLAWFETKGACPLCRAAVMPRLPDPSPIDVPNMIPDSAAVINFRRPPLSLSLQSSFPLSTFNFIRPQELALGEDGAVIILSPCSVTSSSGSIDYGSSESDDDDDDDYDVYDRYDRSRSLLYGWATVAAEEEEIY